MTRYCGTCTLCCTLLPVSEIGKKAGVDCVHQCATGCAKYAQRPTSCVMWSCRWLLDDAGAVERPDRCHYVIDVVLDKITIVDDGKNIVVPTVQVWVDPLYPDAHRDPALRHYLTMVGELGYAAQIRYSDASGFVLFPPAFTKAGFEEVPGEMRQKN